MVMEQAGTEDGEKGWSRLTAATVLVRTIPAVIGPITHPELGDAAVVVAFELHRVAEFVWERRRGDGGQSEVIRGGDTSRAWPGWASWAPGAQGDVWGTARGHTEVVWDCLLLDMGKIPSS